jgi:hypothetical protein
MAVLGEKPMAIDSPHQVILRHPLQRRRWQHERLLAIAHDEVLRHARKSSIQTRPDGTFPDNHDDEERPRDRAVSIRSRSADRVRPPGRHC